MSMEFWMTEVVNAKSAREAFERESKDACWIFGHNGETCTIADKLSFLVVDCPDEIDLEEFAYNEPRLCESGSPAGCIQVGEGQFIFFGFSHC